MYQVTITFNNREEMLAYFDAPMPPGAAKMVSDAQPADKPKRTRKTAATAEQTAELAAVQTVTIVPKDVASVTIPVDLFASSAPQTPAPVVEVKQPEQKDLIAALRAAYDKKADSAIAIVAHFGVKSVGQIPKDRWAEAIAMANKALA